jgi:uncharacterized protein (DUF433 family)
MINDLMYDRGRGPELRSCRITVYDLIPYLEHPETYSDETMLAVWPTVNRAELEALKVYIAEHREEVMAVHRKIEERIQREWAAQDTPEFRERTRQTRARMNRFREWIEDQKRAGTLPPPGERRTAFNAFLEALNREPTGTPS